MKFLTPTGLFLLTAFAHAEVDVNTLPFNSCGLSLSASPIVVAWNLNFVLMAVNVNVTKTINSSCKFALGFTTGGANTYDRRATSGSNTLQYQIYSDAGLSTPLKTRPEASIGDMLEGHLTGGPNSSQTLTFYFSIPVAQATSPTLKAFGLYTDVFQIQAYRTIGPFFELFPSATTSVQVQIQMPKILDLSLVNPGGAFNESSTSFVVNFGNITEGATRSLDLRVRSNAGYRVYFSSQNNGVLRNTSAPNQTVPYTLFLNQIPHSLSGSQSAPVLVTQGGGQTAADGVSNTVSFLTGDPGNSLAGTYIDAITVTTATID